MACGLGGGSLVNAGVILSTPVRARRNPKWPKEWETDWESCEAAASSMLRVQSVPTTFPHSRVLKEVVGEEYDETGRGPLKLSINFDVEEQAANSSKSKKMGSCLACGNCLSGCPYNAKNSTDKNYLFSALQAGCTIKTGCQVQCLIRNPESTWDEDGNKCRKRTRRWRVFLNETDYLTSDFVILSGGVFGTVDVLFKSQMRGLELSSKLGSGFSCNGSTSAYIVGSKAPVLASLMIHAGLMLLSLVLVMVLSFLVILKF